MGRVRWAGSGATGSEVQMGQGVQVSLAGGSGQFGRVGSQVRWGERRSERENLVRLGGGGGGGGGVPGVGRYLTPSYLSSLSPKPLDPIPSVLLHIVVCD